MGRQKIRDRTTIRRELSRALLPAAQLTAAVAIHLLRQCFATGCQVKDIQGVPRGRILGERRRSEQRMQSDVARHILPLGCEIQPMPSEARGHIGSGKATEPRWCRDVDVTGELTFNEWTHHPRGPVAERVQERRTAGAEMHRICVIPSVVKAVWKALEMMLPIITRIERYQLMPRHYPTVTRCLRAPGDGIGGLAPR